jgi:hypothetical protein
MLKVVVPGRGRGKDGLGRGRKEREGDYTDGVKGDREK